MIQTHFMLDQLFQVYCSSTVFLYFSRCYEKYRLFWRTTNLFDIFKSNLCDKFFFSFFLSFAKMFYIVFYPCYVSTCRRWLSCHQALFCKYLHLQCNVFVIYDEAKPVPQRPSHIKVPQKHAANRQGSTSRKSMTATKLLLCTFVEITLRHGCPRPL